MGRGRVNGHTWHRIHGLATSAGARLRDQNRTSAGSGSIPIYFTYVRHENVFLKINT